MADTPPDVVAQERRRAPMASAAALIAGLLVIAGPVYSFTVAADQPRVTLPEALGPLVSQGRPAEPSPAIEVFRFFDANLASLLVGVALSALAPVAMGLALAFLIRATRNRRPDLSRVLEPLVIASGVLLGVTQLVLGTIVLTRQAALATAADQSAAAVRQVSEATGLSVAQSVGLFAQFGLAGGGFVYGSLSAMRVGLLTRFMGILGIAVGVLYVLGPFLLGGNQTIIQTFFLLALGLLFRGRWPGGVPPAWVSGQAEPWPTQLELREARERGAHAGNARGSEAGKEPEPARERAAQPAPAPAPRPHSSSKKKKRKRR